MFEAGFPRQLRADIITVERYISSATYYNHAAFSEDYNEYSLTDGQSVSVPYRIYFLDTSWNKLPQMTQTQQRLYHAIFTRSCNGYIRESHLRALLDQDIPEWIYPYILGLSGEYVFEIAELLYEKLSQADTYSLKEFCRRNQRQFVREHRRMISYWNEYYREFNFYDYDGRKLFHECLGYSASLET